MKGFEIIKNDEAPIYAGVEYGSVSVSVDMALNSNKAYLLVRGNHFKKRLLIRIARYRYSLVECDKNEIILL